jgi:hypothetical protein
MVELSSNLLLAAFFIYIFATIAFSITIIMKIVNQLIKRRGGDGSALVWRVQDF